MQAKEKILIEFLESINTSQEENALLKSGYQCISSALDNTRILIARVIDEKNIIIEKAFSPKDKTVLKSIISNFPASKASNDLCLYENVSSENNINSCLAYFIDEGRKEVFLICLESKSIEIEKGTLEFIEKTLKHLIRAIRRLRHLQDMSSSVENLKDQNSHLRESNFKISSYINNMTHEFKNPLAAIQGFADLLISKQKLDSEGEGYARNISEASNRIKELVDDFLDLSIIESESECIIYESFNLESLINESIESFKKINKLTSIDLEYNLKGNVSSSPKHLRQVVDNLISNAIKYSPKSPKVKVSVDKVDEDINLIVSDNGIGIDPSNTKKIFERFYRVKDKEVENISGTGLGLSICKEIADNLGGSIQVESTLGKGTKVIFSFPSS